MHASNQAADSLHQLFAGEWEAQLEDDPARASRLGDRRYNDRWPDLSLTAIARRQARRAAALARLRQIDRARLSAADQLNYDLFEQEYATRVEGDRFHWHLLPMTQRGGVQTDDELADSLPFETARDLEEWLARLLAFPTYLDQTLELLRGGIEARMLLPRVVMQRVPPQIEKQLVGNAAESPFYRPFRRAPANLPAAEHERLARAAASAIAAGILPAFERLSRFFTEEYLPACPDQVGVWQLPAGEELYAYAVRRHTTTMLTPAEVHQVGREEVARIRAAMEATRTAAGFRGTLAEFFGFLRSDPRFYYRSGDELLAAYRALSKRIDPELVKVFRTLPRTPYGVEPIPAAIAPDTTTAYYRPPAADGSRAGSYFVNLYQPEARPKWEMMALSLHEAVPGHHLQIALAMEQGELPQFRRHAGYTAYLEGWALYAESLGQEMGLYDDPYDRFGQLAYEMWRAVRLVVDTGIHAMRWDRQRAIDYFMENAPKQELDVVNEIDRYISWPGQSLAYKIGEIRIWELRRRAAAALGPRFDLRAFHEALLRDGALPLDILERRVEGWVSATHAGG